MRAHRSDYLFSAFLKAINYFVKERDNLSVKRIYFTHI